MVTHRLSCFSYVFLLANSMCWPLIHFFCAGQLNVLAYLFFFTGQLNVLAFLGIARWISSALVTRFPKCLGNTS